LAAVLRDTAPSVIYSADTALEILTDPDVPSLEAELLQGLTSEDANVRAVCAGRLRAYHSPHVVKALVAALNDTYYWASTEAAYSLGYLGDPAALSPLRALAADIDASIRGAAVASMGRLGDDESFELLLEALDDPSHDVRENAALGIAFLNLKEDAKVASALIKAVGDAYPNVRAQAAFALGEIGGLQATTELERLVSDTDPDVAKKAVQALVEATGGDCPPVLLNVIRSGPPEVVLTLLTRAPRIENLDLIPRIEELLEETSSTRGVAVAALAWIHQRKGTEFSQELATAIDEQELILRRRLALDPDDAGTLNDLAWLLAGARHDLDAALACARRAAYLSPTARHLDTLAEVHRVRGELTEAILVLQRPELLDGTTVSPSFNRSRIQRWQQRARAKSSAN
jgi:HEAT repeat protein